MNTVLRGLFVRMVAEHITQELTRSLVRVTPCIPISQYQTVILDLSNISPFAATVPVSTTVPPALQNTESTSRKRLLHEDEGPSKKLKLQENPQLAAELEKVKKKEESGPQAIVLTGSLAKIIWELLNEQKALKAENPALLERLKAKIKVSVVKQVNI